MKGLLRLRKHRFLTLSTPEVEVGGGGPDPFFFSINVSPSKPLEFDMNQSYLPLPRMPKNHHRLNRSA